MQSLQLLSTKSQVPKRVYVCFAKRGRDEFLKTYHVNSYIMKQEFRQERILDKVLILFNIYKDLIGGRI